MANMKYCFKDGVKPTEKQQRGLRKYNKLLREIPPREPELKEEYYFKVFKMQSELTGIIEEL